MKDYYNDNSANGYFSGDSIDEFSWTEWQKKIDNENLFGVLDELDFIDRLDFANSLIMDSENAYSYVRLLVENYIHQQTIINKLIAEKYELKNELNKYKNRESL